MFDCICYICKNTFLILFVWRHSFPTFLPKIRFVWLLKYFSSLFADINYLVTGYMQDLRWYMQCSLQVNGYFVRVIETNFAAFLDRINLIFWYVNDLVVRRTVVLVRAEQTRRSSYCCSSCLPPCRWVIPSSHCLRYHLNQSHGWMTGYLDFSAYFCEAWTNLMTFCTLGI